MARKRETATRESLLEYVREVADLLELKDWRIQLTDEPSRAGTWFSIASTTNQKSAWMRLAWNWTELTGTELRRMVIHEMLHLHWEPAWDYVTDCLSSEQTTAFKHMAEYSIDGIARAIAEHYPLPPFKCWEDT